jgi:hypothetical protein
MRAAALLFAALLAHAAAQDCYESGERGQGAEGFPAWPYKPCCDGSEQVPRPDLGYGKWCVAVGGGSGGTAPPTGGATPLPPVGGGTTPPPVGGGTARPTVGCEDKVRERDSCQALVTLLSTFDGALDGFTFCSVPALGAEVQACAT